MANEAQIRSSLLLRVGNLFYKSPQNGFTANVSGSFGPVPGAIRATTDGVDVDLSALTSPGLCVFKNLDANNPVKLGRWSEDNQVFYPMLYALPGESYVIRLDPDVDEEYSGTATATGAEVSTLRVKGVNGEADCSIEAFES